MMKLVRRGEVIKCLYLKSDEFFKDLLNGLISDTGVLKEEGKLQAEIFQEIIYIIQSKGFYP